MVVNLIKKEKEEEEEEETATMGCLVMTSSLSLWNCLG
jgi:hypothetical protein